MLLGRYEVLKTIGVGGFGRVLLARMATPGPNGSRLVAIKRLRGSKAHKRGSEDSFRSEAQIGQTLSHPNVVKVFEFIHQGRDLIMVMEYIMGLGVDEMLGQLRLRNEVMPPDIALEITLQAALGLHHAHTAVSPTGEPLHIVHRDVKPSNIMVGREGVVRVMDFGVARWSQPRVNTTTGTIKGTLRYLSPEQSRGSREVGAPSDQFALGLVLCEMLIGRPVYDADQDHQVLLKALRVETRASVMVAEEVCPGIGAVLSKVFIPEPSERYPSMLAFHDALKKVIPANPSGLTMAEWVHMGLEERARLAEEDPDYWGGRNVDDTQDELNAPGGEGQGRHRRLRRGETASHSNRQALGWIHDNLPEDDDFDEFSSGLGDSFSNSSEGEWIDLQANSDGIPILARKAEPEAGWAMFQKGDDELDFDLLRNEPMSDEWALSELSEQLERKSRRVTDLSSERQVMSDESLKAAHSDEVKIVMEDPEQDENPSEGGGLSGSVTYQPRFGGAAAHAAGAGGSARSGSYRMPDAPVVRARDPLSQVSTAELLLSLMPSSADSETGRIVPAALAGEANAQYERAPEGAEGFLDENTDDLEAEGGELPEPSPTTYSVRRPGGDRVTVRRRPRALRFSPQAGGSANPSDAGEEAGPDLGSLSANAGESGRTQAPTPSELHTVPTPEASGDDSEVMELAPEELAHPDFDFLGEHTEPSGMELSGEAARDDADAGAESVQQTGAAQQPSPQTGTAQQVDAGADSDSAAPTQRQGSSEASLVNSDVSLDMDEDTVPLNIPAGLDVDVAASSAHAEASSPFDSALQSLGEETTEPSPQVLLRVLEAQEASERAAESAASTGVTSAAAGSDLSPALPEVLAALRSTPDAVQTAPVSAGASSDPSVPTEAQTSAPADEKVPASDIAPAVSAAPEPSPPPAAPAAESSSGGAPGVRPPSLEPISAPIPSGGPLQAIIRWLVKPRSRS